jgi:HEAT repeat protein
MLEKPCFPDQFMKFPLLLAMLVLIGLGCRPQGGLQYEGKSLRYWETKAASNNLDERAEAAKALGKIGPPGLTALMPLLKDPSGHVRSVATLSVMRMGPAAVPKLKELIHDPDDKIHVGATNALIQVLVTMRGNGVPPLVELLHDRDPRVREAAARSFLRIGMAARTAVPALKEALYDENARVRSAAALTLRIIEPKKNESKIPMRNSSVL